MGRPFIQLSGLKQMYLWRLRTRNKLPIYWELLMCLNVTTTFHLKWTTFGYLKIPADKPHRETLLQKDLTILALSMSSLPLCLSPIDLTGIFRIRAGGKLFCSYWLQEENEGGRKQCFILQHLVQSAPWGWTPIGGCAPAVKESGGCKLALCSL